MKGSQGSQKRSRAPKVTLMQLQYLISYMEDHNAFATGQLLEQRGKACYDSMWQELANKLNCLNGPSKAVDAWKKVWSDQRNKVRARAAQGKAQRRLTGNIGETVLLKDSDLRILSVIGAESAVGLPLAEQGLPTRQEDSMDPSLLLGIKHEQQAEDGFDDEKENVLTESNINITDDFGKNLSCHSLTSTDVRNVTVEEADLILTSEEPVSKSDIVYAKRPRITSIEYFENKPPYTKNISCHPSTSTDIVNATIEDYADMILSTTSKEPESKSDVVYAKHPRIEYSANKTSHTPHKKNISSVTDVATVKTDINTPVNTISRQSAKSRFHSKLTTPKRNLNETINHFKSTQEKGNQNLETIASHLNRIASATEKQNILMEQQNILIERSIQLHEQTLNMLTSTVDYIIKNRNSDNSIF